MKMSDISNGPDWVVWVIFGFLVILSILLISGHGSWLIAGYNTASEKDKSKYDAKRLCKVTGIGIAVVSVLILVMDLFEEVLPAGFACVSAGIIILDCLVMIILCNTICRKR